MGARRVCFVLQGGGMRGVWSWGVIEALLSFLPKELIAGFYAVSSGAPTAAYAATGQWDAGRRIWTEHVPKSKIFRRWNILSTIFGRNGNHILQLKTLRHIFTEIEPLDVTALQKLPYPVQIGVTDAETGEGQLRDLRYAPDPMGLILASMALPGVHAPFPLKDRHLVDGSIALPIPMGNFDRITDEYHPVVILTHPKQYRKKGISPFERVLVSRTLQGFPHARAATHAQAEIENSALILLMRQEREGLCTVIAPREELAVTRYGGAPHLFHLAYHLGCDAGQLARAGLEARLA